MPQTFRKSAREKEPKINELTTIIERPRLPVSVTDTAILRVVGIDGLASLILEGHTQSGIAEMLGIPPHSVSAFIYNLDTGDRAIIRAAQQQSAERIIDKAGEIIDAPTQLLGTTEEGDEIRATVTAAEVSFRKLKAEHQYRRAAQRNSSYRDKGPVDPDAASAVQGPPQFSFTLQVMQAPGERPTLTVDAVREPD